MEERRTFDPFARLRATVPKVLRLTAFVLCVQLAVTAALMMSARAQVEEMLLGFGAEMMRFPEAEQSAPRELQMNGASLMMTTGVAPAPMAQVLDHFEAQCQLRDGRWAEQIAELERQGYPIAAATPYGAEHGGTLRFATRHEGFVACLDTGSEVLAPEGFMARLEAFLDSGDLSVIGNLRYAYVRPSQEDPETKSFVLNVWSDSPVNIYEMFPSEGDAVGSDPEGMPRPPEAQRILAVREVGEPYGMWLYASRGASTEEAQAFYRAALVERGWELAAEGRDLPVAEDGTRLVVAEREGRLVTVGLVEDPGDPEITSLVTIVTSD